MEFINTVRGQCRKVDLLEAKIKEIHQSSEDIPELLIKEYEQEYKNQLTLLGDLLRVVKE